MQNRFIQQLEPRVFLSATSAPRAAASIEPALADSTALMSAATHAAGLHFGVYYSILNWADANASAAGINTYMQTMETQLSELITHDHPDLLWFDGEWPSWWTDDLGQQLAGYVRGLDPAIIINNRVGKRLSTDGDYDTPEQMVPTNEPAEIGRASCRERVE